MIGGKPAADVLREMRSGGFATPVAATGSMEDFIGGVKALTAAGGRNLSRKAAVEELNQQRMQAGMPALDTESVLNEMLQQDREPEKAAATERLRNRTQGVLTNARASFTRTPIARRTPTLLESAFKGQYQLPVTGARE